MRTLRVTVTNVSDGGEAPAGWVKVTLPGVSGESESGWVEWPSLAVARGFGLWFPPRVGQRALALVDDDDLLMESPLVMHAYWDEDANPPGTNAKAPALKLPADSPFAVQVGSGVLTVFQGTLAWDSGSGSTRKPARSDLVETRLQAIETALAGIKTAINSHTHSVTITAFNTPTASANNPTALVAGMPATSNGATAATSVTFKE
ncbi:MAG TPA: phage baseplate assembly protein V [Deinococcales bacterium]|nr:phage baseplate assembly protein V [Deinococcales bacterium]